MYLHIWLRLFLTLTQTWGAGGRPVGVSEWWQLEERLQCQKVYTHNHLHTGTNQPFSFLLNSRKSCLSHHRIRISHLVSIFYNLGCVWLWTDKVSIIKHIVFVNLCSKGWYIVVEYAERCTEHVMHTFLLGIKVKAHSERDTLPILHTFSNIGRGNSCHNKKVHIGYYSVGVWFVYQIRLSLNVVSVCTQAVLPLWHLSPHGPWGDGCWQWGRAGLHQQVAENLQPEGVCVCVCVCEHKAEKNFQTLFLLELGELSLFFPFLFLCAVDDRWVYRCECGRERDDEALEPVCHGAWVIKMTQQHCWLCYNCVRDSTELCVCVYTMHWISSG